MATKLLQRFTFATFAALERKSTFVPSKKHEMAQGTVGLFQSSNSYPLLRLKDEKELLRIEECHENEARQTLPEHIGV